MVPSNQENVRYGYCSISTSQYPVCSGIEDESNFVVTRPFGYDMCYGRGVCDTDLIPKHELRGSSRIENNKSTSTGTTSTAENVAFNEYFEVKQWDFQREKNIQTRILKDPAAYIPLYGFRIMVTSLNQDLKKHSCGARISSPHMANASSMSMRSSLRDDHSCAISKTSYENALRRNHKRKEIELAGPFTEPPNPGKQMKLGEPYYVHLCMNKDFYKDF